MLASMFVRALSRLAIAVVSLQAIAACGDRDCEETAESIAADTVR